MPRAAGIPSAINPISDRPNISPATQQRRLDVSPDPATTRTEPEFSQPPFAATLAPTTPRSKSTVQQRRTSPSLDQQSLSGSKTSAQRRLCSNSKQETRPGFFCFDPLGRPDPFVADSNRPDPTWLCVVVYDKEKHNILHFRKRIEESSGNYNLQRNSLSEFTK